MTLVYEPIFASIMAHTTLTIQQTASNLPRVFKLAHGLMVAPRLFSVERIGSRPTGQGLLDNMLDHHPGVARSTRSKCHLHQLLV